MHELSLAEALVEQVEAVARREKAAVVESVTVEIGALSGVDREAFAFAFPMVIEGTDLARIELKIGEVPAEVKCAECGKTSTPEPVYLRCGACGSTRVEVTGGRDFLIRSVELR